MNDAEGFALTDIRTTEAGETAANVAIDPDAPWFSGHFPGNPMVPGIVQLAIAFELVRRTQDAPVRPAGVRRVRFKQILRPGDGPALTVRRTAGAENTYSFRLMLGREAACTGTLIVEEEKETPHS